jgi:MoxR-like ATPase
VSLGYPGVEEEKEMCRRVQTQHPIETLTAVTTADQIVKCQQGVREITVGPDACDYLVALTRATREHAALRLGASPRGSLGLYRAAQSLAAIQGQSAVSIDQIQALIEPVLAHRLLLRREAVKDYPDAAAVLREIAAKAAAGRA